MSDYTIRRLEIEKSSLKEELSQANIELSKLHAKYIKLKSLILLTDYSVSSREVNDLSTAQWIEFIHCFPDEKVTPENKPGVSK